MIKKAIYTLLFACTTIINAQSMEFTSAELTTAELGSTVTVNYKYTSAVSAQVYCALEKHDGTTSSTTVADAFLSPLPAGTDLTGSFALFIPSDTELTADLTGDFNYKIFIEMRTEGGVDWLEGDYPTTEIDLVASTNTNSITITSPITTAEVGNTITVNFKYTSDNASNYIYCRLNLYDDTTRESLVAAGEFTSAPAGTDMTGSITITIPAGTTLTSDLTDLDNYKLGIEMKEDVNYTLLADNYPSTPLNIVAGPPVDAITFTTPTLTKALIGNTIQVDYKLTSAVDVTIYCAINSYDGSGTRLFPAVADGYLGSVSAGTDVLGSFLLTIPSGTTKTSDLAAGFSYSIYIQIDAISDNSYIAGAFPLDAIDITNVTNWTGNTDNSWSDKSNWDVDVPNSTSTAIIPASKTVEVYSTTGASVNTLDIDASSSLTIFDRGSLLSAGSVTGNINYKVFVDDTNWHLVSSPLVGAQYDDTWVTNNDIATGSASASNRGISSYNNAVPDATTGPWSYYQGSSTETFEIGVGYGLKKATGSGNFTFTGTMPTTVTPTITQDANNWNLVGNSFPSYMDVAAFIVSNGVSETDQLSDTFQAIYVWDGTSYNSLTTGYLQPGQAFFVNSKVSSGTVSMTTAMQSHQTSIPFYKTSTPSLNLSVSNGLSTKKTQLNYFNDKTNGLDPGFDIGMFNGVASDLSIYTHLIENNEGIALGRQALAISEMESQIIPIGLKAEAGKELTFSIEALNLPNGIEVYLEDRAANTFSSLTDGDLKIILNEDVNGIGKFYLQLSSSALSIDKDVLERVSMYTTTNANLRIVGLPIANTSVKLFNLIGKEVYRTSFKSNNIQNVSLSKLSKGLYIVQIQSEGSILNKKIILE
jgi:hypothetical protein